MATSSPRHQTNKGSRPFSPALSVTRKPIFGAIFPNGAIFLETAFGENWLTEAQALNERPTLDLRANTLKATRDKVLKALAESGAEATRIARQVFASPAGEGPSRLPNVTAELSFQKGWFEVQDEGSQIVADLAGAHEGSPNKYSIIAPEAAARRWPWPPHE